MLIRYFFEGIFQKLLKNVWLRIKKTDTFPLVRNRKKKKIEIRVFL